jgi:hypothetical protein
MGRPVAVQWYFEEHESVSSPERMERCSFACSIGISAAWGTASGSESKTSDL